VLATKRLRVAPGDSPADAVSVAPVQEDVAGALLDPSFAILHGLYWLCANLAQRCPVLLCIDDVHWADQASLRFLHYLGRRLEELRVAVVAAARPASMLTVRRCLRPSPPSRRPRSWYSRR
jgi:hypothetical protein